jgi:hypothetical protein
MDINFVTIGLTDGLSHEVTRVTKGMKYVGYPHGVGGVEDSGHGQEDNYI